MRFVPGIGYPLDESSITRTQSLLVGGVRELKEPVISVEVPFRGSYQYPFFCVPEIKDRFMEIGRDDGKYAIKVELSSLKAAPAKESPDE
jgi:hypothetical protein